MPDVPDIHVNPPAMPLLALGSASVTGRASARLHAVSQPQLRTGRLIWTGTLGKNAELSLTPAGASSGVLNGSLPGVPVRISLQPAQLVDNGLAVYSNEAEQSGANESPSAWNGWKVVIDHNWDPKRFAEVSIVEPPGPANNWKRLVLRSGNRSVAVVVVNWQRLAP
jgi:hypothetical protein